MPLATDNTEQPEGSLNLTIMVMQMLGFWRNFLAKLEKKKTRNKQPEVIREPKGVLGRNFAANVQRLKDAIGHSSDVVFRFFYIGGSDDLEAVLIYIAGLVDKDMLNRDVLQPLMYHWEEGEARRVLHKRAARLIQKHALAVSQVKEEREFAKIINGVFVGDTALLLKGAASAVLIGARGFAKRDIAEPEGERLVRGPREGFIETLEVNTALIRRRIRDPNLVIEAMKIGKRTQTEVAIVYIRDIADPEMVEEVKHRLGKIKVDAILDTGYLAQYLEDNPYSVFPQILLSERPDRVAGDLLEGRVAVLVDGSPFALLAPTLFIEFYQISEDQYERFIIGSFLRILRLTSFVVTLFMPATYIALISFHHELVPEKFLRAIAEGRMMVPFPPVVEALIMEFTLEVLREAGIRLPGGLGQAVGVVGGIIIGEAAVRANLVSPAMVVVVTFTAIASFTVPVYGAGIAQRLLRFLMMILAALFGAYGVAVGGLFLITHLASLESFGVPYFAPLMPTRYRDLKDAMLRAPLFRMRRRPASVPHGDDVRQAETGRGDLQDENG